MLMTSAETRDLIIPPGITRTTTVHGHLSDRAAEQRGRDTAREQYRAVVGEHLRQAATEGWVPAHAVDFDAAAAAGRLRVRTQVTRAATAFGFGEVRATTITHTYESVIIGLRRAAP
jgi:hypothetical protein